jgi:S-adenosylmethionine decarboxylase
MPGMDGLHLTADLRECDPAHPRMTDAGTLRALCVGAVARAGLQPVGELFHRFPAPGGVTGVVLLAESHLAVHTWPELGAVTLDVYVCNFGADNSARADTLMAALCAAFAPGSAQHRSLRRGAE